MRNAVEVGETLSTAEVTTLAELSAVDSCCSAVVSFMVCVVGVSSVK